MLQSRTVADAAARGAASRAVRQRTIAAVPGASSRPRRDARRQLRDFAVPGGRLSQVLLALLLVLAAGAFARAEQLKLERSPIAAPHVRQVFSARCNGGSRCTGHALLRFRLRHAGVVALAVVDDSGTVVRHLMGPRRLPRGTVRLRWNGRTDAGRLAPDGRYRLRVELRSLGRTITIPDRFVLDNTWPTAHITGVAQRRIHGAIRVTVRWASSEHLAAAFLVARRGAAPGGRVIALRRGHRGQAVWDAHGVQPGLYRLVLVGSDAAGNVVVRPPAVTVRLR